MLETVAQSLAASPYFTLVAGVASIISLWLSFLVFRKVSKVQAYVFSRTRLPVLREQASSHGRILASHMQDYEKNRSEIRRILLILLANLEGIQNKIDGSDKIELKKLCSSIETYLGIRQWWQLWRLAMRHENESRCRTIHERLNLSLDRMNVRAEDDRWRIPDVLL